jgi:pimeloyl-ACP methyl ester carboxylesterase
MTALHGPGRTVNCRLLGVLLAIVLAAGQGAVRQPARAAPHASGLDGCVRAGSLVRIVTIAAERGNLVPAAVLGRGAAGVVLANQSDRDLCSWLPFAQRLRQAGYRVLLFDYGGAEPSLEVAAAARTLRRLGSARVILIGASEGAKASIIAAARPPTPAKAVVSLSAERYLRGTDVKPWAAKLRRPILFITARSDPYSATDTRALYRACTSRERYLATVPGDAHGVDLLRGATGPAVRRDIFSFVRRHP